MIENKFVRDLNVPLYEYKCVKCGHRFEKIESVSAAATKKCPECGGKAERLLAAPAIQFKGSGWYVTDYAGRNADGSSKEAKETKEAPESKPKEAVSAKDSSKAAAKKAKEK
jgi:putative FmdB family regulatory protein